VTGCRLISNPGHAAEGSGSRRSVTSTPSRRLISIRHFILATAAVVLTACGALSPSGGPASNNPLPAPITKLINELEAQPPANPPAFVASYDYGGQVVYYVPPRCCDIFGDLYDANGQVICHPDGGLAGKGDGRCPDFNSQRTNEKIIWRDLRRPS
jgi:hypothetical protein